MIYPETDPQKFSDKHGVPVQQSICRNCGIHVWVDIPVISHDFVGFESLIHECGEEFKISLVKIRKPSK